MYTKYLIVGAGLAGLSSAYHLKENYVLVESSGVPGGTASTTSINGFILENGVHIMYFKYKHILELVKNILEVKLVENKRRCSVWIGSRYINFPIQYNLAGLPFDHRFKSVASILRTLASAKINPGESFDKYSRKTFGNYLTELFVQPYNEKLFGTPISEMNTKWMGDYIPTYSKFEMIASSIHLSGMDHGRNSMFYYPEDGGISSVSGALLKRLSSEVLFNNSLERVKLKEKIALFSDGTEIKFDYLINTIPLKLFLNKVEDLPKELLAAQSLMKHHSTSILHLMLKGEIRNRSDHWIYVADKSVPFYRITIPGNINSKNCPTGYFALTLEFGGRIENEHATLLDSIIALNKMGLISKEIDAFESNWNILEYGYVIYDANRAEVLNQILPYLSDQHIYSIGRYGQWEYSNMEDAIYYGKQTADYLLND